LKNQSGKPLWELLLNNVEFITFNQEKNNLLICALREILGSNLIWMKRMLSMLKRDDHVNSNHLEIDIDAVEDGDKQIDENNETVTFNERIDFLIRKLNIGHNKTAHGDADVFRKNAYVLYIRIKKWLNLLKADKLILLDNQRMLSLKYHGLKKKIDFVQISVIAVASCITFIDSVKQYVEAPPFFNTVFPIMLSTYIGFVIAIARFYKWDDTKENLTKMNEKLASVINQLWSRIKFGTLHKNIQPSLEFEKYFNALHEKLDDLDKDGLGDTIIQLKQDIDVLMDYSEKLLYKERLSSLKLQDAYISKKIKTVDHFEEQILHDNRRISKCKHKFVLTRPLENMFSAFGTNRLDKTAFFKENLFKSKNDVDEVG